MMIARVFINEGRPAMAASREQLLEDAPPGCNAFLMLAGRHFTTWAQSPTDQQWYKLDSIPFSSSGRVRRLQSLDWEHFQGEAYCMVRSDPYIAGETLHESLHYDPPRMHEAAWVDATQLQLSRHRQHKVIQACQLYEWGPDAQEQGQAAPEPIQVEEQLQMDEQAPPAHAPAHAAAPPEPMQMDEQAPPARAPVQGPQQQRRHPPAASAKRTQNTLTGKQPPQQARQGAKKRPRNAEGTTTRRQPTITQLWDAAAQRKQHDSAEMQTAHTGAETQRPHEQQPPAQQAPPTHTDDTSAEPQRAAATDTHMQAERAEQQESQAPRTDTQQQQLKVATLNVQGLRSSWGCVLDIITNMHGR
jgi:hypothetical protein